ncbi:putative defense protein 3 [Pristis pectinata]|uniref:putative defense protein 3 n=1 Tax=Pristis pectinata TaxID=685728 RepID=UPI00223DA948|nr:putative defense protein 3 [Pristis pectinata]
MPSVRCAVAGLLALCLPLALALPGGAPASTCGSMAPAHASISPQTGSSPHSVNASVGNGTVEVRIMGPTYKGLLLQAREPNMNVAVGTWSTPPMDTKTLACFNSENSSITHSNTKDKSSNVVYTWNPPSNNCIKVAFVATVAQSKETYWLKLRSNEIEVNCNSGGGGNGAVKTTFGFAMVLSGLLVRLAAF